MPNETLDAGTTPETGEAPEQVVVETPAASGTPSTPDEVTTLRSRNQGLDAKVTSLSQQLAEAQRVAAEAQARALALAEGKENGDAELRAQLEATRAEAEQARQAAKLASIAQKYPETVAVLGDIAAALTDDQLAASEARYAGVAAVPETPVPVGNNPQRTVAGPKSIEDMSLAELRTHLGGFAPSTWGSQAGD